jgi:RHS repeat-associated protein
LGIPAMNLAAARVTYRFNGQQVAMHEGVTLTFVYGDHLGSVSVTANLSGTKVSEVRYYPFGEMRYSSGNTTTPKRFNAKEEQIDIGLYDYGARFYDPAIGRFVSADSVVPKLGDPQNLNRYAYNRNNPLKYVDPTGHDFEDFAAFLTGIAYGWGNANTHIAGLSLLPEEAHRNAEALTVRSADFAIGRMVGDGIAIYQGLVEMGGGIGGAAGGGLLCLSGVGCIVGGPAVALSAGLVIHGGMTALNAAGDLGTQMILFADRTRRPGLQRGVENLETAHGSNAYEGFSIARKRATELSGLGDDATDFIQEVGPMRGRITGRQSPNGERGWRIDWDGKGKDVHVNWWDRSAGKARSDWLYGSIHVEGASWDTYQDILSHFPLP